jgi:hypothetical protein
VLKAKFLYLVFGSRQRKKPVEPVISRPYGFFLYIRTTIFGLRCGTPWAWAASPTILWVTLREDGRGGVPYNSDITSDNKYYVN